MTGTPRRAASSRDQRLDERVHISIRPDETRRLEDDGWVKFDAEILNVSAGGLLVASREEIHPGDYLEMAFVLPGGGVRIQVRMDVIWAREEPGSLWQAGCQFQDRSGAVRELIFRAIKPS